MCELQKTNIAFLFLTFLVCSLFAHAATFSGKVVAVKDGDTVMVMHEGQLENIRLNAIDCPEKDQDFWEKSKQFTYSLCFDQIVKVVWSERSQYGDISGTLFLADGRNVNQEIVRSGMGWWHRESAPSDTTMKELEESARVSKVGLWADANPIAPWDFKKSSGIRNNDITTPEKKNTAASSTIEAESQGEVYVTKTGKKFHSAGCHYLNASKIPMALKDAVTRGYTPCSVCKPSHGAYGNKEVAPVPNTQENVSDSGSDDAVTVYTTRTGSKYHSAGCRYLKSSIPMTKAQAKSRGLAPCSVCGGG